MTSVNSVSMAFGHAKASTSGKPYGIQSIAIRDDLPIAEQRQLSEQEQKKIQEGMESWWPKISPGFNSKPSELLADPGKVGVIQGAGLGALATGITGALLSANGFTAGEGFLTALIGIGSGVLGFMGGLFTQRQKNENVVDMMKRLPEGATLRDMMADPLYREQLRPTYTQGDSGWGSTLNTVLLASALTRNNRRD